MKLLNQSVKYLSISILGIVTVWAVLFYISMLSEIKSSVDEGLENHKRLIINNAAQDTNILNKNYFDESFFTIRKIDKNHALLAKDTYIDTEIDMQDADDKKPESEPVRMLITAFENNGNYYELKVVNSMVEEDDLIDALLWNVLWLYVVLILGVILINNVVLKKLWKPFYDFLHQLKSYRLGSSLNFPEVTTKTKEFIDLQKAVTSLLDENVSVFEQQKQFIGNASHELQTPLAIATNKLELLLENETLQASEVGNIAEIYEIIQRLIRLNKSLLLLSKIENKQFFDNQKTSINKIVHQNISNLKEYASFKNIEITLLSDDELIAEIDPILANIIVSNLLKNAIFHNIKDGNVEIKITDNRFIICNNGIPISLNKQTIFQRFQKSTSHTTGTGLGLAIVKSIADLYAFPVKYSFSSNKHCFEIQFFSI